MSSQKQLQKTVNFTNDPMIMNLKLKHKKITSCFIRIVRIKVKKNIPDKLAFDETVIEFDYHISFNNIFLSSGIPKKVFFDPKSLFK